ncbi:MAG: pyridoxal-phosphate dependent enzyme [Nanoarchaeota archaeon]
MLTKNEEAILNKILIAEKDPKMPKFPASRTYKISVPGFSNVWLKDESTNETGTHKDRMAWEIVMAYKEILIAKKEGFHDNPIPSFSIISAGSAALAIQNQLRKYNLPNLKILTDDETDKKVLNCLKKLGCEIFITNLDERPLTPNDVLSLTNNVNGFDLTSNTGLDPSLRFYDWLSYEILNNNPEYVFIPFGTGQLYENVLNTSKLILNSKSVDKVYTGNKKAIKKCNFFGATTNFKKTKAVKLFAPFRPFTSISNDVVRLYSLRGLCGNKSKIYEVEEKYIEEAYDFFKKSNINAEHSAVAGLALLCQIKNIIPKDAKILILSTGKAKFNFVNS